MVDWVYRIWNEPIVQLPEGIPPFTHIKQNELSGRRQIKQKEEDIAVCECKYDVTDPESACGERCLNVLTSTECMPGYCPCGDLCKNQRFQKSEYTKTKLFKTEGRGWGLLADENIKSGQFIIEYCGEVISAEEAKQRSQTYEAEGLKDAYIISLNASYFIDATRKGSLARFINHSCQPNCETRKWTVLGETRVGIFASQDIPVGTELAYDYNFEWYGGANVRCLCGAPNCSIFLGAKSHGFQEHNHVWEDGDDRYEVDEFPLYDSAEDEPMSKISKIMDSFQEAPDVVKNGYSVAISDGFGPTYHLESASLNAATCLSDPMDGEPENKIKAEVQEENHDPEEAFAVTDPITSSGTGNYNMSGDHNMGLGFGSDPITSSGTGNYNMSGDHKMGLGFGSSKKSAPRIPNRRPKHSGNKQVNGKRIAHLFPSRKVQEEIIKCEDIRTEATSKLEALYDEIRPAIEERERDSLDSLPTSVAEKWIEASCSKMKADMELYFSIVKNVVCPVPGDIGESNSSENAPIKSEK